MQKLESRGLVLFNRNYRENDKLVKIFTEQAGKRMFFVRGGGSGKLSAVIQPLTIAEFIMTVNDEGLSFIEDYSQAESFKEITSDIFKLSYATYLWRRPYRPCKRRCASPRGHAGPWRRS